MSPKEIGRERDREAAEAAERGVTRARARRTGLDSTVRAGASPIRPQAGESPLTYSSRLADLPKDSRLSTLLTGISTINYDAGSD